MWLLSQRSSGFTAKLNRKRHRDFKNTLFSRQTKAKRIGHLQTCCLRNFRGRSSSQGHESPRGCSSLPPGRVHSLDHISNFGFSRHIVTFSLPVLQLLTQEPPLLRRIHFHQSKDKHASPLPHTTVPTIPAPEVDFHVPGSFIDGTKENPYHALQADLVAGDLLGVSHALSHFIPTTIPSQS